MVRRTACVAAAFVFISTVSIRLGAQEAVLSEFYGSGVHQYFARNYSRADSYLAAATNGGSKDPRPYYYRALVDMRMGRSPDANLQKAAALESADINQLYPVGKSLERVQGPQRMTIERYRAVARAEAHQRQQRRDAARYEQRKQAEADLLRPPAPAPAAARPPAPAAEPEDPFAEEVRPQPAAAEPADEMPADQAAPETAPSDEADPFATPAAGEPEMTEEKAEDAKPAEAADSQEEEPAASGDENSFAAEESKDEK